MGIRTFPRRPAIPVAVVLAALPPAAPAYALGASTARLPAPSRSAEFAFRVSRDIRKGRTAFVWRLRVLPLALRRRSGPACVLAGHRQEDPAAPTVTAHFRAALALARACSAGSSAPAARASGRAPGR